MQASAGTAAGPGREFGIVGFASHRDFHTGATSIAGFVDGPVLAVVG